MVSSIPPEMHWRHPERPWRLRLICLLSQQLFQQPKLLSRPPPLPGGVREQADFDIGGLPLRVLGLEPPKRDPRLLEAEERIQVGELLLLDLPVVDAEGAGTNPLSPRGRSSTTRACP